MDNNMLNLAHRIEQQVFSNRERVIKEMLQKEGMVIDEPKKDDMDFNKCECRPADPVEYYNGRLRKYGYFLTIEICGGSENIHLSKRVSTAQCHYSVNYNHVIK
jgi:hypothetical protein